MSHLVELELFILPSLCIVSLKHIDKLEVVIAIDIHVLNVTNYKQIVIIRSTGKQKKNILIFT